MRDHLAEWYPISVEDRQRFITEGMVVLDTNVLLNLYRMTQNVQQNVLSLFEQLQQRLWVPHQVALEFHRNRFNVIHEQEQADQKLRSAISDAKDKIVASIKSMRDHPVIDRESLESNIEKSFAQITDYLDNLRKDQTLSVKSAMYADAVLDAVTSLLHGKVGEPYPDEQMSKILADAKRRIDRRIPPGYADAKKDDEKAAGDYILWRQTLDEAAKRKMPVLFITNDQKEDWYRQHYGLTVGPRVELISEMRREAGVDFHAQTLVRFIESGPGPLHATIDDETVSEVNRLDEITRARSAGNGPDGSAANSEKSAFLRHNSSASVNPVTPSERDSELARLEARRRQISQRIAELKIALETAEAEPNPEVVEDPRSYKRALEARLGASNEMLADVVDDITNLRRSQDRR